ncbi:MAG: pyridoxine 5'-phosphate synthase [Bacteroidia bacterium]|nr:pyridoxine 5'-phosphate synthase [Bacteroidia bacterium]
MTKLSVNINKFATLRNARGTNYPDVIKAAVDCQKFGAQGITVHPRPDERHIKYQDVYDLLPVVNTEFNIEGNPNPKFLELIKEVKPTQVTLVPDGPDVLTSDSGWDTITQKDFLIDVISELKACGIRTSIFVDPEIKFVEGAAETGVDRIELYTEPYAANYENGKEVAIADYVKSAKRGIELGLGINAGHDLNLDNLRYFKEKIPEIAEVSIGHAIVCDAIYLGLGNTIQLYLQRLKETD